MKTFEKIVLIAAFVVTLVAGVTALAQLLVAYTGMDFMELTLNKFIG